MVKKKKNLPLQIGPVISICPHTLRLRLNIDMCIQQTISFHAGPFI